MQPLAVVTGASTGIGLEIARELARRRYDLVVCADKPMRDAAELERAGADVTEVVADLSSAAGVEALIRAVQNRHQPLTVLALNVGIARGGLFLDTPLADQLRVVDLNIRSTVHVAHELLPAMITRGQGRVLLTSSVASALPGPYQATYNASKSFVQSLGEALRVELAGTGVTLTLLRPGATDTALWQRAGLTTSVLGRMRKDDPGQTARLGVAAMMAGRRSVVSRTLTARGWNLLVKVLPAPITARLQAVISRPRP